MNLAKRLSRGDGTVLSLAVDCPPATLSVPESDTIVGEEPSEQAAPAPVEMLDVGSFKRGRFAVGVSASATSGC